MMTNKKHIYPLGIVGNCSYLSYIDKNANVSWQCWPYFDSSFIFGGLLDKDKGGSFSISPTCINFVSKQQYIQNTNILETTFECSDGKFKVIDFAPRFSVYERFHKPLMLFRKIELIEGTPCIKVTCNPVGDYGKIRATSELGSNHIKYSGLQSDVRLTTNIAKSKIISSSELILTENKYLVLSWGIPLEAPLDSTFESFYRKTKIYWRNWVERSSIPNFAQDHVIRSSLLLKLHQFEDTGAIIASGTTSLPEYPNSARNWDYRYCWIRDSYFTLSALTKIGHFTEAESYAHYLQGIALKKTENIQPVYKIDGTSDIPEEELDLDGYLGNKPVRIGNLAYQQIQNDVYGQIILSLLPLYCDARVSNFSTKPSLQLINKLLNSIIDKIDSPDAGIWEYRNIAQKHTATYLFHWAGGNAAKKIAIYHNDEAMKIKSERVIKIASEKIEHCFQNKHNFYSVAQGSLDINASEILLITMNYLKENPEKALLHLHKIEDMLKTSDDLIFRYKSLDDFGDTHSTFLICGFWYAEALACLNKLDRAQEVFYKLAKHTNHLGIFSEDISPQDGSQWGNFAQTYSHVGLINAAFRISSKLDKMPFET